MADVIIGGKTYRLGEVAGTQENFDVLGQLLQLGTDQVDTSILIPGARRMLQESIANGFGDGADPADASRRAQEITDTLSLKLSAGSEFWNACIALLKWINE